MKKLTKILAAVLTFSMAMSTVVMPASAADITYYKNYTFTSAEDATAQGGCSAAAGLNGKDATDGVAITTAGNHTRDYATTYDTTTGYVTYEAEVYIPTPSTQTFRLAAYNQGNSGQARTTLQIHEGVVQFNVADANHWQTMTSSDYSLDTSKWNKLAMTWEFETKKVYFYVNDTLVGTMTEELMLTSSGVGKGSGDFGWASTIAGIYIDNIRAYNAAYDTDSYDMPLVAGLSLVEGTMTVAEAKALALDTQAGGNASVHVYKNAIGGAEAADTDVLQAGWKVVITSLDGNRYNLSDICTVSESIEISDVTFTGSSVMATVTNNGAVIPSMMMVLVENGGQFVMSSAVATNIDDDWIFEIEGVDSADNAEIFFVESWDNLVPVTGEVYTVE